jgi:5-deoxy-D-glucuronate isomerase
MVTVIDGATLCEAPAQDPEPSQDAKPADRTKAERGATASAGVRTVRTAEAFVRRDEALICTNAGQGDATCWQGAVDG